MAKSVLNFKFPIQPAKKQHGRGKCNWIYFNDFTMQHVSVSECVTLLYTCFIFIYFPMIMYRYWNSQVVPNFNLHLITLSRQQDIHLNSTAVQNLQIRVLSRLLTVTYYRHRSEFADSCKVPSLPCQAKQLRSAVFFHKRFDFGFYFFKKSV